MYKSVVLGNSIFQNLNLSKHMYKKSLNFQRIMFSTSEGVGISNYKQIYKVFHSYASDFRILSDESLGSTIVYPSSFQKVNIS